MSNFTDRSYPNNSPDVDHLGIPLSTLVAPFTSVLDSSTHVMPSLTGSSRNDEMTDAPAGVASLRQKPKKVPVSIGLEGSRALGLMLKSKSNLQKLM
jgi:hypothetical protein